MGLRARWARRREERAGKRMALRLALFLAAVIALPFLVWQFELYRVLGPTESTEALLAKCENLEETLAKVERSAGGTVGVTRDQLEGRISECDEMGVELTTGSVGE